MQETDETAEEQEEQEELDCFLAADRVCNASCSAYVTFPRESAASELNKQSMHCAFLLNMERLGRNLTIVAQVISQLLKKKKTEDADKRRSEQFVPPPEVVRSPFGGKNEG